MTIRRRLHDDRGASLILAMVFLTVLSLLSVSVVTLTGTGAKVASTADAVLNQDYSADAGMEAAIQALTADQTKCTSSSPTYTLPSTSQPTINGVAVSYSCTYDSGGASGVTTGSSLLGGVYSAISTASTSNGNMGLWVDTTSGGSASVTLQINGGYHTGNDFHFDVPSAETLTVNGQLTAPSTVTFCEVNCVMFTATCGRRR